MIVSSYQDEREGLQVKRDRIERNPKFLCGVWRFIQQRINFIMRWIIFMVGLMIMAFGIVLMIQAKLGAAPWDVLHVGLNIQFGLTIGTWSILAGLGIITFTSLLNKSLPQVGAIINMFLVGVFIDLFMLIPWLETPNYFLGKLFFLLIGMIIIGYGIGIYIAPKCGAGPRDTLMLELTERTGWKVQWVRGLIEVVVLFFGWMLGGPVFIGTLLFTFGIGSIVGYTLPRCQRYVDMILERCKHYSGGVQVESFNKGTVRVNHHDGVSQ
jgi:uncharacterized membrane protein YczE